MNNIRAIAGDLSGNLVINLAQSTAVEDVAIAQPAFGRIAADEFRGRFSYNNGAVTLAKSELRPRESWLSLSGGLPAGDDTHSPSMICR